MPLSNIRETSTEHTNNNYHTKHESIHDDGSNEHTDTLHGNTFVFMAQPAPEWSHRNPKPHTFEVKLPTTISSKDTTILTLEIVRGIRNDDGIYSYEEVKSTNRSNTILRNPPTYRIRDETFESTLTTVNVTTLPHRFTLNISPFHAGKIIVFNVKLLISNKKLTKELFHYLLRFNGHTIVSDGFRSYNVVDRQPRGLSILTNRKQKKIMKLLGKLEWAANGNCILCQQTINHGHTDTCEFRDLDK